MTDWDVIVVGGGVGGLSAAAHLAVGGQRVLLLEQYGVVGGCGHVFRRPGGWQFEVGIHYLGDCGPGGTIPSLLRGLGLEGHVEFAPFDRRGYDTIVHPGGRLPVAVGWDAYRADLHDAFPREHTALDRYLDVMEAVGGTIDRRAQVSNTRMVRSVARAGKAALWALRPFAALLDACGLSPEARTVVSTQWISYACPPSRAPVLLHAGFLETYTGRGAYYPRGGGQVIAASLVAAIEAHGGEVRTNAGVRRILVAGGRVAGVELHDGQQLRTGVVVSNADLMATYHDLIGPEHTPRRVARNLSHLRTAVPWFNTYFGLDVDLAERMPATNFFSVPTCDRPEQISADLLEPGARLGRDEWLAEAARRLPAFVHSASRVDGDSTVHAPPGHSVLEVMTNVPADPALWGTGDRPGHGPYRHGTPYRQLKEALLEIMLDRAEAALPGVRAHVVYREASTPWTHARYTGSVDGNAYGIELSVPAARRRPKTNGGIPGLFLAGTSTRFGPAIEGVMFSGAVTAGAIVGRDLAGEALAGAVNGDPARLPRPDGDWDPLAGSRRAGREPSPRRSPTGA